ncbi:DUF6221 family protein [Streptomyces sparsogenes]|uniref:DUF6221 family protein n=1 Tax=Streptomyces sparsogenes TaxID=67365 RepID=UPI001301E3A1|nr:DUF6221 family protein [Streptomyces sparsogenes]
MDELVRWLGEQLDEEEATAFTAGHLLTTHLALSWRAAGSDVWPEEQAEGVQAERVVAGDLVKEMPGYEVARARALHIAGHDPDRVMGEIDVKRRMIGRINSHAAVAGRGPYGPAALRLGDAAACAAPGGLDGRQRPDGRRYGGSVRGLEGRLVEQVQGLGRYDGSHAHDQSQVTVAEDGRVVAVFLVRQAADVVLQPPAFDLESRGGLVVVEVLHLDTRAVLALPGRHRPPSRLGAVARHGSHR